MHGLATIVPMLFLAIAASTLAGHVLVDARDDRRRGFEALALAAIAGVGVAACAVETLRRLKETRSLTR